MSRLYDFYWDVYQKAENTATSALLKQIEEHLRLFEHDVIAAGWIDCRDLHIVETQSAITKGLIRIFSRKVFAPGQEQPGQEQKVYRRLLRFHQKFLQQSHFGCNKDDEDDKVFASIRVYFKLQGYQPLKDAENNKINDKAKVRLKGTTEERFDKVKLLYQPFLDHQWELHRARQRDPQRLHEKFMRVHKPLGKGKPSEKLYQEIVNPSGPGGIKLEGYAARSVIIALHKMINSHKLSLEKTTLFYVGTTRIAWKDADNHGVVFLEIGDASNSNNCIRPGLPYNSGTTDTLTTIQNKLKINLMAEIVKRFSSKIKPFSATSFEAIKLSPAEVNFLNGFAFLTQICEVARYLKLDGREIESKPISIALAVTKHLLIKNQKLWEQLYAKAPPKFATAHQAKLVTYGKKPADVLGGLDPASGKSLKQNIPVLQSKIERLNAVSPGYLSNIPSARDMRDWMSKHYGSGGESDNQDSVYSSDDDDYQNSQKEKMKASFDLWLKSKMSSSEQLALLNPEGFSIVEVPSDGNCLFHAVADQLNKIGRPAVSAAQLRERAINHMLQHWHHYSAFCGDNGDSYIAEMIENGAWADHPIIQATAEMLRVNITIHRTDGAETSIAADFEDTIYLGYYVGVHYVSLEKVE